MGLDGRTAADALNCLGNTHGGMEYINGQWYVFYHRQTNRTQFSRQGCAEKIEIAEDGSIRQVPVTSCGLNDGPLEGKGTYPAYICCRLTGRDGAVFSGQSEMQFAFPYLTQDVPDREPDVEGVNTEEGLPAQYIANVGDGTVIGYKSFCFDGVSKAAVLVRGSGKGTVTVSVEADAAAAGTIRVDVDSDSWQEFSGEVTMPDGVQDLYFRYDGEGCIDFIAFSLEN